MKLKIQISLFVLLTFTMSTVFAMTFTTTQAGGNSSKDITVQVGKQYQLKFDLQHQTTNNVRVQIIEGSAVIVDASYLLDGSHVYSFTPTSNTVTLIFIREDNDNVSRDFEVNNLVYEEVLSTIQAESNHVIGRKEYELADHLGNVRAVISDKPKNGNAEVISATDYLPFGMTARTYSNGSTVRYGYSGKEKENEISEGDYDFGARIYDSRLARWLAVDPIIKPNESPYTACSNNPLLFVDPNGKDTLYIHAQQVASALEGKILVFKITFSIVKDGVETPLELNLPSGAKEIYYTVPAKYWTGGNVWYTLGTQEEFEIRFEEYHYDNSIRLKYVDNNGKRILAHYAESSSWSVGCNMPTTSTTEINHAGNIVMYEAKEIQAEIKRLYKEHIQSKEKTDKFGRMVDAPQNGDNFLMKTNSESKSEEHTNSEQTGTKSEELVDQQNQSQGGNEVGRKSSHAIPTKIQRTN